MKIELTIQVQAAMYDKVRQGDVSGLNMMLCKYIVERLEPVSHWTLLEVFEDDPRLLREIEITPDFFDRLIACMQAENDIVINTDVKAKRFHKLCLNIRKSLQMH